MLWRGVPSVHQGTRALSGKLSKYLFSFFLLITNCIVKKRKKIKEKEHQNMSISGKVSEP